MGAYLWWQGWLRSQHITSLNSAWIRLALTLVALFSITSIHEMGHAVVGMFCGMRLRAFFVGPFQWRIRDAKWEFEFKPKGLILADGENCPHSRRWKTASSAISHNDVCFGALANILTGILALILVVGLGVALPPQVTGFMALFGAWSLGLAAANLLPFRTPQGYSDGAIVLQLLSGGAFAEFHLSIAHIGSSLISSLRPRDYDIGSIRSAAKGIAHGRQALLMWLYAFSHSIDAGNNQEADEVLDHAELVCLESAAKHSGRVSHRICVWKCPRPPRSQRPLASGGTACRLRNQRVSMPIIGGPRALSIGSKEIWTKPELPGGKATSSRNNYRRQGRTISAGIAVRFSSVNSNRQ